MSETINGAPAARPMLLTIICVLSFLFGIYSVFEGVRTFTLDPAQELESVYAKADEMRSQFEAMGMTNDDMIVQTVAMGEKRVEARKTIGLTDILVALVSLFGVWLMWNLRKRGFPLYVLAGVAGLAAPLYHYGSGSVALMAMALLGFFTILFIILYAVNLKHMH